MPKKSSPSKMVVKDLEEKQTRFEPVPYETTDVCTSITLLSSSEKDVVTRALWTISKYADAKDANVEFLYKNGVVPPLFKLILYSDLTILRFSLKLLAGIATTVPQATAELSSEQYSAEIKDINSIFMMTKDSFVREFATQILSRTVKDDTTASFVFTAGVVVPIFEVLKSTEDPDVQLNTLVYFNNVLNTPEAPHVLPFTAEFSARTLFCFLKSKLPEIREAALNIIEKLVLWKSAAVQQLLKDEHVVEKMLTVVLTPEYKPLHKQAFNVILTCMECLETASYFVKSLEFVEFCQWAKTCPKGHILPSVTILTALTKLQELKQILFDFAVEDTILSFFRTNNERVFYKTCEAVSNMSSHRYCCDKMVTPVVVECLLSMLSRTEVPIIPYHEIALRTLFDLMKRSLRAVKLIANLGGISLLTICWLRSMREYTYNGFSTLMDILYVFSADTKLQNVVMNSLIYKMLLETFRDLDDFSHQALLVLNQYVDNSECRQYFLDLGGPEIILNKISSTPTECLLKDILIFLQRMFLYKRVGKAFLMAGSLQILKSICDDAKEAIPLINQLIGMMYDLYKPIKFYELNRLETTDHFTSRFYMIKGTWKADFPFLEILNHLHITTRNTIYLVDFSANANELTQKPIRIPFSELKVNSTTSLSTSGALKSSSLQKQRTSILKNSSSSKSQKGSVSISEPSMKETSDFTGNCVTCQIPPPINYGSISEDPYLPKYVEKLKLMILNNKKYVMCFQHQVKLIAQFVCDLLSGPEGVRDGLDAHCLDLHIAALKAKLGTNVIPIGYLRCGSYCEKALLFKALADKVGVPVTLIKGQAGSKNSNIYWNEVPILTEEPYANIDDKKNTYLSYAVVNLMNKVGELMLVGSLEANKYCHFTLETDRFNDEVIPVKFASDIDFYKIDI